MQGKNIYIDEYSYDLPDERIAKYPLDNRDQSKILIYKNGEISHKIFSDVINEIPDNSLLAFNNTKVIRARLHFQKDTGAKIEIFCLEPHKPSDYNLIFQQKETCSWKCMVGNAKKWKEGKLTKTCLVNKTEVLVHAEKSTEEGVIHFNWNNPNISFAEILESEGEIPIPPYLNRKSEQIDTQRYQTVYSRHKGSVAAPTAGLHFTDEVLNQLLEKQVKTEEFTLHVGAGTFKPVKTETVDQHEMHSEQIFISLENLRSLLTYEGNITTVGTTTVRTLESVYWLGVKIQQKEPVKLNDFRISQWECYELPQEISLPESIQGIINKMEKSGMDHIEGHTQIMITPGYKFRVVNRLITNFHQPKSTLLLLIAAFIGEDWKKVYSYALENDFRFLSYGDSSLLYSCEF